MGCLCLPSGREDVSVSIEQKQTQSLTCPVGECVTVCRRGQGHGRTERHLGPGTQPSGRADPGPGAPHPRAGGPAVRPQPFCPALPAGLPRAVLKEPLRNKEKKHRGHGGDWGRGGGRGGVGRVPCGGRSVLAGGTSGGPGPGWPRRPFAASSFVLLERRGASGGALSSSPPGVGPGQSLGVAAERGVHSTLRPSGPACVVAEGPRRGSAWEAECSAETRG